MKYAKKDKKYSLTIKYTEYWTLAEILVCLFITNLDKAKSLLSLQITASTYLCRSSVV